MARGFFLFLLLANVAFFVWNSNYLGRDDDGREPNRLKEQLQVDRLAVYTQDASVPSQVCRRVGPLTVADAERLKASLEARGGVKLVLRPIDEISYWVYIPPLTDKAAADKKAAELKRMGIEDFLVVADAGAYRNAISLGSFHDEETARDYFDQISKKGVRTARIDQRARAADQAALDVLGAAGTVDKGLATLAPSSAQIADCTTN
jgi:hypothetical protein